MSQTFQQPQQPTPVAREFILIIPETQMPSSQVIQPTQQSQAASQGQQQQSRGQLTSFIVVEDRQQAGPSRPITSNYFNPPLVTSATGKESQHNLPGLSSFFGNIPSVLSYQQIDTPQLFLPAYKPATAASPPTTTASQQEHQ